MRASILAASLIATALAGAARAEEIEIPGASRTGPTFQRPTAENPEMQAYVTAGQPSQAPTPPAAQVAGTAPSAR